MIALVTDDFSRVIRPTEPNVINFGGWLSTEVAPSSAGVSENVTELCHASALAGGLGGGLTAASEDGPAACTTATVSATQVELASEAPGTAGSLSGTATVNVAAESTI